MFAHLLTRRSGRNDWTRCSSLPEEDDSSQKKHTGLSVVEDCKLQRVSEVEKKYYYLFSNVDITTCGQNFQIK